MSQNDSNTAAQDSAWASIRTPLSRRQLSQFCTDIERLFRINPFLEFSQWRALEGGRFQVDGRNISQDPAFDFSHQLSVQTLPDGLRIDYSDGLKAFTRLTIEDDEIGSKLTIVEDYGARSEEERQQRLGEVDKSLLKWAGDLQVFLLMWKRWSWFAPWRWYMRHVWQPLKPSARRIVYMLIWISVIEAALIILGGLIYWLEYT